MCWPLSIWSSDIASSSTDDPFLKYPAILVSMAKYWGPNLCTISPALTSRDFEGRGSYGLRAVGKCLHFLDAFDEGFELAAARRMTQLAERLGFDLADALAGDLEALAYFFEGVLG